MSILPADPFARITSPFGELLDPDGYREIRELKRPSYKSVQSRSPKIFQLANGMHRSLAPAWRWGYQYVRKTGDADWREETVGSLVNAYDHRPQSLRDEPLQRWAEALQTQQLAYHLCGFGRTLAVGNSPVADWYTSAGIKVCSHRISQAELDDHPNAYWCYHEERYLVQVPNDPTKSVWETVIGPAPRYIDVIRIDVDHTQTWLGHDHQLLKRQLSRERGITTEAGLDYSVFRTGGRGTQAVLRLPNRVSLAAGWWLSEALSRAFRSRAVAGADDFKHAFDGILRLPGGVHLRENSFGLGLWLDPETAEILPLADQVRLMPLGTSKSLGDGSFEQDAEELSSLISTDGLIPECSFAEATDRARHIDLVRRCCEISPSSKSITVEMALNTPLPPPSADSWAENIWNQGFEQGEFYQFVTSGGIRAAHVLFDDGAEEKLKELAASVAARPGELQKRYKLIAAFCKTHRFLPSAQMSELDELSEKSSAILFECLSTLKRRCSRKDAFERNVFAISCAICLFDRAEFGEIEMSGTFLHEWIRQNHEGRDVSSRACLRAISDITEGDQACKLGILQVVRKGGLVGNLRLASRFVPTELVLDFIKGNEIYIN